MERRCCVFFLFSLFIGMICCSWLEILVRLSTYCTYTVYLFIFLFWLQRWMIRPLNRSEDMNSIRDLPLLGLSVWIRLPWFDANKMMSFQYISNKLAVSRKLEYIFSSCVNICIKCLVVKKGILGHNAKKSFPEPSQDEKNCYHHPRLQWLPSKKTAKTIWHDFHGTTVLYCTVTSSTVEF